MRKVMKDLAEVYMHVSSGKRYYPFNPRAEDVDIEVIAHHLANRARWAGATQHPKFPERIFYSVAEHSVYVSRYLENEMGRPDLALAGLLHDGSEAYNGDLIRPLKYSPAFREPFKMVEMENEAAVEKRFNVGKEMMDPAIKIADDAVCHAEYVQIVPRDPSQEWAPEYHDGSVMANIEIIMFSPYDAKKWFLHRFWELGVMLGGHDGGV
jgi:hypothetical protein